ncbi:RluA family pseudouridine synthase [Haloglycomyces albus]|uniref:RluA family pseudouridine synthase n=1 Tax=Haloglycomyces albus TaxID=526067 RepID=UPI00046CE770|nr:RNA pseudouridine synthase [Haloglycomyces albus]
MDDWASIRSEGVAYEDEAILILNKPAGWSVMGERHAIDLVRLAEQAGETLHPVHRIDKVTSGAVLFAKSMDVHGGLTRQFNKRTVDKDYLAIVDSDAIADSGRIDLPLSVGRKNRVRIAAERSDIVAADGVWSVPSGQIFDHVKTYPSVTEFTTVERRNNRALLRLRPLTGRRHQIRVHLAWIGFAIVGDPLFKRNAPERTGLHSARLAFDADWLGRRLDVTAPPGNDFWDLLPGVDPTVVDR